ncbi:MAG: alpha/beta hydrolase, partial [Methanothrix sp.]|nr:alpha/beta hydrolase [Methanothrix sp.]
VHMTPEQTLAAKPTELLWPNGTPGARGDTDEDRPALTVCLPPAHTRTGVGIIVMPGGGYSKLALGHEAVEVAEWLNAAGIAAFLLRYRLGPRYLYPAPLDDARRAIRLIRSRAHEWGLDPNRIGGMGFSAGAHLLSLTGVHIEKGKLLTRDPVERASSRPDFMILAYPLIVLNQPNMHRGTMKNLFGPKPERKLLDFLSTHLHVTAKTPPTFLFHITEDHTTSAMNSILFYQALYKAGVPCELHIYEQGKHGGGLYKDNPALRTWPDHCLHWLRARGILPAETPT